ncbi:ATP-dependent DNA helicase PIF1-like protein [Tanacetum coccineum]
MNEGSSADHPNIPTLANMLNKSIFLTSNTNIGQDGKVHSYCGLRLTDIPTAGATRIDHSVNLGRGPYTFRINGQNYHRIGSLLPTEGVLLRYAQLYFFDTQNEIKNRMSAFMSKEAPETVDEYIVANLIQMLDQTSAMAKSFRMAKEWCRSHGDANLGLRLLSERTTTRQYNAPTVSEVSALIINDFGDELPIRDIVVNKNNTGPQRISELHLSYMVLQYPLLFPFGEDGYHENIPYNTNKGTRKTKRGWTGKRIVLPQTYVRSPRYMMHNYQDAMALCRTYGNPDLFITFTSNSNPKWPEIAEMLAYILETVINEDGYPVYRCRDNKITAVKGKFTYDNRDVVPHNRGAQSFTDLKMVNKINYATFKAACFAYGLLNDDKEWTHAIAEASIWAMAPQLRDLFVTILYPELNLSDEQVRNYCLLEIQDLLNTHGKSLSDFKDLPQPDPNLLTNLDNRLLREALSFDANKSKVEHEKLHSMLNPEQRLIYEHIIESVHNDKGQFCFIHGLGGTWKTFLYKTIIARLRSEQMIVLVVASLGIASLLLPAGRTAHSRFVIPLELMENSTCGIKQGTHLAELLQHVRLIIWDEAPMSQRYTFKALHKTLQDILGYQNQTRRNLIFRGMTVLLGGDFRQTLPVIPNATRPKKLIIEIKISIDGCWLWVMGDYQLKKESEDEPTWIEIPEEFLIKSWTSPIEQIIAETYPDFTSR